MTERVTSHDVVEDVRQFFLSPEHWIYRGRGTPTLITPNSIYHITQVEVLFEDQYPHDRTYRALRQLREEGFLDSRDATIGDIKAVLVWRSNVRYVERAIKRHLEVMARYSAQGMNKATGDYAELLTRMGLTQLHLDIVGRNSNSYRGKVWMESAHNLDFVMEQAGSGYGVEVKNTFDYFPDGELDTKLKMCEHLGILPLFIARYRHPNQWTLTRKYGGLLYVFKSKIFPPGQEPLAQEVWQEMRLPVAVWNDWPGHFYPAIKSFLDKTTI